MFRTAERIKGDMESTSEHRERIAAAVQVDRLFNVFQIEMTPAEAIAFAEVAPPAGMPGLRTLVVQINAVIPAADFGPDHRQTGKPHHSFRIGRQRGNRLIRVSIFKGYFQIEYDFMALLEAIHALGTAAGAKVTIPTDNNSYSIDMRWGDQ